MTTMGKSRDLDGTVDRIPDPPSNLWPFLYAVKAQCEVYSIDLASLFEEACVLPSDRHIGKIPAAKFYMTLNVHLARHRLSAEEQQIIDRHYGMGPVLRTGYESIAWKDFCEDVLRVFTSSPTSNDYQLMDGNAMSMGGTNYQATMAHQGARAREVM